MMGASKSLRRIGAPTMKRRCAIRLLLFLSLAAPVSSAKAALHFIRIGEVYSNYDGTVQFIELYATQAGQTFLNGTSVSATSTVNSVSTTKTAPITSNVASGQEQSRVLLATPGLAITPDFPIPARFFDPFASETVFRFSSSGSPVDTWTVSAPWYVPRDGISSVHYDNPTAGSPRTLYFGLNSPRNNAGQSGVANLFSTTGDYNFDGLVNGADYVMWRNRNGQSAVGGDRQADVNNDGATNSADYNYWRARVGNSVYDGTAAAVIPERTTALFIFTTFVALSRRRRKSIRQNRV
jgi:hypothetical protein